MELCSLYVWPRPSLLRCERDQTRLLDPTASADTEHCAKLERRTDRPALGGPLRCEGPRTQLGRDALGPRPELGGYQSRLREYQRQGRGIESKPAFREAFHRRRCLVPVDNFYEWANTADGKQPYAIALADQGLMALAGLWENWRSSAGEWVRSFAIVTTTPNELCAELHNRMPVVLGREVWPAWLGEEPADPRQLKALLAPYPSEGMTLAGECAGRQRQEQ